jgi:hypothetical protein
MKRFHYLRHIGFLDLTCLVFMFYDIVESEAWHTLNSYVYKNEI